MAMMNHRSMDFPRRGFFLSPNFAPWTYQPSGTCFRGLASGVPGRVVHGRSFPANSSTGHSISLLQGGEHQNETTVQYYTSSPNARSLSLFLGLVSTIGEIYWAPNQSSAAPPDPSPPSSCPPRSGRDRSKHHRASRFFICGITEHGTKRMNGPTLHSKIRWSVESQGRTPDGCLSPRRSYRV